MPAEEKACQNCRYIDVPVVLGPCGNCSRKNTKSKLDNWEEKNKMENIKMQPGKIYIATDDGKKLEFFGVVEFKPDLDESAPKINKKLSDLSFSGSATFETPIKKFLEAVFGSFRKKKSRRDKYQQFKQ